MLHDLGEYHQRHDDGEFSTLVSSCINITLHYILLEIFPITVTPYGHSFTLSRINYRVASRQVSLNVSVELRRRLDTQKGHSKIIEQKGSGISNIYH